MPTWMVFSTLHIKALTLAQLHGLDYWLWTYGDGKLINGDVRNFRKSHVMVELLIIGQCQWYFLTLEIKAILTPVEAWRFSF